MVQPARFIRSWCSWHRSSPTTPRPANQRVLTPLFSPPLFSLETKDAQAESLAQRAELMRQQNLLVSNQDRLLNMRINDEIDQDSFAHKQTELRDRLASIKLQQEVVDRSHDENAELAVKVFELSQTLRQQWLTADYAAKRRILDIVFLNSRLDDTTLVPTIRKPFDVLIEGLLVPESGGGRI
jgi:site-specific DNA recombinase